jgi:uncharacterized protein YcnI
MEGFMIRNWRAAAGAFVVGLAGAITLAAPAAADVTVTPNVAPRGGPAELAFTIPEDKAGAHTTKVELVPPAATPIAEIYPMSINGWAPISVSRELDKPVELIHGTTSRQVVAKITWSRVGKTPIKAGQPVVLKVSMGPMPQAPQVAFTIVQTYSDGTVVRWSDAAGKPAPVVKLLDVSQAAPPQAGQQAAGPPAADAADKSDGNGPSWFLIVGVLVAMAFAVEGWVLYSARRRASVGGAKSSARPA